jgi:hypothetical protein
MLSNTMSGAVDGTKRGGGYYPPVGFDRRIGPVGCGVKRFASRAIG